MADTLVRLLGPTNIPEGNSILFTGLQGHIYTIKNILVTNNTVSPISLSLGVNGLENSNLILPNASIDAGGWADGDGLLVLANTDTLQASSDLDGLAITISGLDQAG